MEYSDPELIELLSTADSKAFQHLYQKYFNMIKYFVQKNSGSSADADDLFQEVLVILFEKTTANNFSLSCSVKTFIYSIARNQWLKKLRQQRRITNINNFEEFVEVETDYNDHPQISIKLLLNEIGDACRKLLILFYYRKKSMEEISSQLNYANADSVKNQKYKCVQRLKKIAEAQVEWN